MPLNTAGAEDAAAVERLLAIWDAIAPPIRPSRANVADVARLAGGLRGRDVLILGATPELIDLAVAECARRIVAMDWSAPAFAAMRRLGRRDWSGVETLCWDWREPCPALLGRMEAVLGDGSLILLPFPRDWERVFRRLHEMLRPHGVVVVRCAFAPTAPVDAVACCQEACRAFDAACAAAPETREARFRELLNECLVAVWLGATDAAGEVTLERRIEAGRDIERVLVSRYAGCPEWPLLHLVLPDEVTLRSGAGRGALRACGVPTWDAALALVASCGFRLRGRAPGGAGPASRAMQIIAVEREA
jgi:hypothetical protein